MKKGEVKRNKALYFDMSIECLKRYYSESNPKGAYNKIKAFMTGHGFTHVQYSGYHSKNKMTDLEIFDLIHEMSEMLPWLSSCMSKFEVTNIGVNHDLMVLFEENIEYEE